MKKVIALLLAMAMVVAIAAPAFASPYEDVADTHWAAQALEVLSALGIITGYPDGTFRGQQNITRYEVAIAIYRALEYLEWNITNESNKFDELDDKVDNLEGAIMSKTENLIIQLLTGLSPEEMLKVANDIAVLNNRVTKLELNEGSPDQAALANILKDIEDSKAELAKLQEQIDALNAANKELSEKVINQSNLPTDTNLANSLNALSGRVSALENKVANLAAIDPSINDTVSALKIDLLALSGRVSALETAGKNGNDTANAVAALRNDFNAMSGRVALLESKLANAQTIDPSLAGAIEELKNAQNAMSGRIALLESKLANVALDPSLSSDVANLKKEMAALSGRLALMESSYPEKGAYASAADFAQLKNDVLAISGRLSAMEAKLANLNTDPTLSATVSQMNKDLLALSGRVALLESKLGAGVSDQDLKYINDQLAYILSRLDGSSDPSVDLITIKNDIAVLSNRLLTLESNLNNAIATNALQDDEIADLYNKIGALNIEISKAFELQSAALAKQLLDLEKQIEAAQNANNALTSKDIIYGNDIAVLASKVYDLEAKLNNSAIQGSEIADIYKEIGEIKAGIYNINYNYETLDPKVADLSNRVLELEKQLNYLLSINNALSTKDITLGNDIAVLASKLYDLESKLNNSAIQGGEIADIYKEIGEIKAAMYNVNYNYNALGSQVADLTKRVLELENQFNYTKSAINGLTNKDIALSNDIAVLASRLNDLEIKLNNAVATNAVQDGEIADLYNQIGALRVDIAKALELQYSELTGKLLDFDKQYDVNSSLNMKDITLSNDVAVLASKLYDLEIKLNNAVTTNAAQDAEIADLYNQIGATKIEIFKAFDLQAADMTAKLLELEKQINYVKGVTDDLTRKDIALSNDIAVLASKLYDLEIKLNNSVTTNAVQDGEIADIYKEIGEIKAGIYNINYNYDMLDPKVADLSNKVLELERQLNYLLSVNNSLSTKDITLSNDIAVLSSRFYDLESKLNKANESNLNDIADIYNDIAAINLYIDSVASNYNELDPRVAEISARLAKLSKDVEIKDIIVADDIAALSNKLVELDTRVGRLEVFYKQMSGEMNDLKSRVAQMESLVLESSAGYVVALIDSLRTEYAKEFEAMNLRFDDFDEDIANINERLKIIEGNMNIYGGSSLIVEPLIGRLNDVENRLDNVEKDIADLKGMGGLFSSSGAIFKLSGSASIEASLYSLNIDDPAGYTLYVDMFNYDNTKIYVDLVEKYTSFGLRNVLSLKFTIIPVAGVQIDLDAKLKTDLLAIGKVNGIKGSDYDINIDITAPGVIARIKGGNIASVVPTISNYSFSNAKINKLIGNTVNLFDGVPVIFDELLLPLLGASIGELHGVYGQLSLFGGKVTVDAVLSDIGWNIIDMVNVPIMFDAIWWDDDGDPFTPMVQRNVDFNNNGLMFMALATYNPIEQLSVGLNAAGVYTKADSTALDWLNSTVFGAYYNLNTGIVKSNGEIAFGITSSTLTTNMVRDLAGKVDLTIGSEPGVVVNGYFERVGENFISPLANMTYERKQHGINGQTAYDLMNVGVGIKSPQVIGLFVEAKLDYKGNANWNYEKNRIVTLSLGFEPNFFNEVSLKVLLSAANTADLLTPGSYYTYSGEVDFAYKSFSADLFVVNNNRGDMFATAAPGTLEFGINAKLNFIKDILYIKGGVSVLYDLNILPKIDDQSHLMYFGEIGLNMPIGDKFQLDAMARYYVSTCYDSQIYLDYNNLRAKLEDDYTALSIAAKLGWNVTEKTSLYAGFKFESRDYQFNSTQSTTTGRIGQDGRYFVISAGLEHKLLKSVTLNLGFESINNKYLWKTVGVNDEINLKVNVVTLTVKVVF